MSKNIYVKYHINKYMSNYYRKVALMGESNANTFHFHQMQPAQPNTAREEVDQPRGTTCFGAIAHDL